MTMTVGDLMNGKIPSASFEGFSTADDMVLAVDFEGNTEDVNDYIVAQKGITEASGKLESETKEGQYLRSGKSTTKTGTSRTFTISGDRYNSDAFQDALLAHDMKYGRGQAVIKPYVYFNLLTGKGEQGTGTIAVENDLGGAVGENASFSATISSTKEPTEFTYAPKSV